MIAAGAAEFMTKPFDPDAFRASIEGAATRHDLIALLSYSNARMVAASAVLARVVGGVFVAMILALSACTRRRSRRRARRRSPPRRSCSRSSSWTSSAASAATSLTGKRTFLRAVRDAARQRAARADSAEFEEVTPKRAATAAEREETDAEYPASISKTFAARPEVHGARSSARSRARMRMHPDQRHPAAGSSDIPGNRGGIAARPQAVSRCKATARHRARRRGLVSHRSALILLFGFYLASSIARTVREAAEGASRVASGELSRAPRAGRPGRSGRADDGLQPEWPRRLRAPEPELE